MNKKIRYLKQEDIKPGVLFYYYHHYSDNIENNCMVLTHLCSWPDLPGSVSVFHFVCLSTNFRSTLCYFPETFIYVSGFKDKGNED